MIEDFWLLIDAAVLIFVAVVFVAIEQSLTRVSKARVAELIAANVRGADRLAVVVDDRARYVNVVLMVRVLAETFSVVLVTIVCIRAIGGPQWVPVVTAGLVMLVISFVFFGVVPRTLGQQHAVGFALRGARLAQILSVVFGPLVWVLIIVGNALTPGRGYRQGPFATQAELREMVDLAEADDVIEEDERQMIHSVFELGDTLAREVMVPRTEMVWIEHDKLLGQGLSLALRSGFSRIPVIGKNLDDVVGVLYIKDLARRSFDDPAAQVQERVEQVMRSVAYVPESKPADELLREMQVDRVHLAIVVDEYGGTAGLITIEDVVEEIVGEIADEHDVGEMPESEALAAGGWRVSSRMQLDDLVELAGLSTSEEIEGVDTVGGLFARRLGVVPIPGSSIDVDGYRLTAESSVGRRHRIGSVLAVPLPLPSGPERVDERRDDDGRTQ